MQKGLESYRLFLVYSLNSTLADIPFIHDHAGIVFNLRRFCWYTCQAFLNYTKQSFLSDEVYIADKIEAFLRRADRDVHVSTNAMFLLALHRLRATGEQIHTLDGKNDKKQIPQFRDFLTKCIDEYSFIISKNAFNTTPAFNEVLHAVGSEKSQVIADTLYEKLFQEVSIPLILLGADLSIVSFNMASADIFDKVKLHANFLDTDSMSPETRKILAHHIGIMQNQAQEQVRFDTYLETSMGNRFFKVMLKQIHFPKIKFHGLLMIFDDLSNRKKIEQHLEVARQKAEEADRLKTAFLANMSHEIRTPMNAIIGFSDMLISAKPTREESEEYLNLIKKSGSDLLNIIDDIIDIAKIEARQLKIRPASTHPSTILADIKKVYEKVIHEKGIPVRIIIDVDPADKDINFKTDPERLKQVIRNLTSNAVKFTEHGEITLGYRTNGDEIRFFVNDTGVGIPATMLDKIFDRFVQADNRYEMNTTGTGLGLTISRSIVQLLGGEIEVESKLNAGSQFSFWLPFEALEPTKELITIRPSGSKQSSEAGLKLMSKTILVAEDEESNFFYLNELLRKTGATILWAKNGLEAINYVEQTQDIDLILMDIKMPEINGLDAIKYVHRIKPEIPIIAQTAFASAKDRQVCLNAGCVDYITKPLNRTLLFSLLEKFLIKTRKKTIHI